jgi:DNA polymerase/3'-5' exonuclease PolX
MNKQNRLNLLPSAVANPGNLLLDVPSDSFVIPQWLLDYSVENGYEEKHEYHITVIGKATTEVISQIGRQGVVAGLVEAFSWNATLLDEYIELEKLDEEGVQRYSIVQMAELKELDDFYQRLQLITDTEFKVPPPHVTLFTKNYARGIGLASQEDIERYSVRALVPSVEKGSS